MLFQRETSRGGEEREEGGEGRRGKEIRRGEDA